jgi:hypothetical protein
VHAGLEVVARMSDLRIASRGKSSRSEGQGSSGGKNLDPAIGKEVGPGPSRKLLKPESVINESDWDWMSASDWDGDLKEWESGKAV